MKKQYIDGGAVTNEVWSSDRIKDLTMSKIHNSETHADRYESRGIMRRFAIVAAAAVLALALATTALAVSGIIDLGKIYNSFFNNPSAVNKIEVGQSIKKNGMEITLLSAFTDGNKAHALLELRDFEGKRLSDSVKVLSKGSGYDVYSGAAVYDDADNKVTLALTMVLHQSAGIGDRLELDIDAILSGINSIDCEPLGLDIAAYANNSETISLDEWNDNVSGGVKMPGTMGHTGDEDPGIEQLLKTDELEFSIPGIDWAVITNIGVIDSRLHLQYKRTAAYNGDYNVGYFSLLDASGTAIYSCFDICMNGYSEMVFDIGGLDLTTLRLAVSGSRIDNVVLGPWNMSFVVNQETPKKSISVIPSDSPYFKKLEIICSPLATSVQMLSDEWQESDGDIFEYFQMVREYFSGFGAPYLTLKDGSTVILEMQSSMLDSMGGFDEYESIYFDIEELYSITFCGEEYLFNSTN